MQINMEAISKLLPERSRPALIIYTLLFVFIWLFPPNYLYFLKGLSGYLPLHMFMEVFSIIVAVIVFSVGWEAYSKGREKPGNIIIIAAVFLAVALIDFAHTLSFAGMPPFVTHSDPEKAIFFWLSGRFLVAFGMLYIVISAWRPFKSYITHYVILAGVLLFTALIYWVGLWHWESLPHTFIAGKGLTPLKIYLEWSVVAILGVAALFLIKRMLEKNQEYDAQNILMAIYLMILSEIFFMLYSDVADLYNFMGHVYKVIAYYYIYRAIFVENIQKPYRELEEANTAVSDLYNNAPCGYHSLDKDGIFVMINDTELSWLGYTRDEVIGRMRFADILTPESLEIFKNNFPQFKERGWVNNLEFELIRKDGTTFPILVSATAIKDSEGNYLMSRSTVYDISERQQAEEVLRDSEEKLRSVTQTVLDALIVMDNEGRVEYWNPAAERIFGYSKPEVMGKDVHNILAPERYHSAFRAAMPEFLSTGTGAIVGRVRELEALHKDGHEFPIELSVSAFKRGDKWYSIGVVRDITERKKTEVEILKLNRIYRMLSECNQSLIRADDENKLIAEICRIITEAGGYRMAWVGYPQDDEEQTVKPVAYAGHEDDYLSQRRFSWGDNEYGRGPTGTAIRTGKYVASINYNTDTDFAPWKEEAQKRGYASSVAFPLVTSAKPFGALSIYGGIKDVFTEEELTLLQELASNLAFGIMAIRTRIERKRTQILLNEAQRIAHLGSWHMDLATNEVFWSEELYKLYGFDPALPPPLYTESMKLFTPESWEKLSTSIARAVETGIPYELELETTAQMPGGRKWMLARGELVRDMGGAAIEVRGIVMDITQRKWAEQEIRHANAYNRSLIEASLDPLVTISPDGKITDVNAATEAVTGHTRDELVGTDFSDYFTEPEKAKSGYHQVFETGFVKDYPLEIKDKDGNLTPVIYNANVYRDEKGNTIGVFAAARDITEQKKAEQALQERERHSQSLLRLSKNLELAQTYMQVIDAARDEVKDVIGYQNLWVFLLTEDKKHAHAMFAGGTMSEDILSEEGAGKLTIEGDKMLEEIAEARDIVLVEDARTDPRTDKKMVELMGNRTIINVPIIFFDKHIGVVGTGTYGDEGVRPPTAMEKDYLRALASHLAVTLDRIHLLAERKKAEQEVHKLNRIYCMLSDCNQSLVRADDEDSLISDICRIISEEGGYRFVWVGYAQDDEEKTVKPVAYAGYEEGYLSNKKFSWGDNEYGRGPTGTAIRTGRLYMNPDFTKDANFSPWKEDALQHGYASSVAFPLTLNGKPMGALNIYGSVPGAFNEGEIALLQELASDLAFGIETIRARIGREHTQAMLNEAQRIAHLGNWELDLVNNVLSWSDEIYRMFEIDQAQFGASYEAFLGTIHPDDRDAVNFAYTNSLETKLPYSIDHRLLFPDGRIKYVHEQCETYYDESGKPLRSVGTVQDVTESKLAQEAFRELSQKNELILNSAGEGIYGTDEEGIITFVNLAAARMLGFTVEELIGKNSHHVFHHTKADDQPYPVTECPLYKSLKEGGVHHGEDEVFWRKGGQKFYVEHTNTPLMEDGKIAGAVVVFRDITERKLAQESLRHANAYNRSLIEASLDPLLTISPDGKITDVNLATEVVTGRTRDELIDTDFSDYFSEPEKAKSGYHQVFDTGFVSNYPLELRHRDGHLTPVIYNASVYRDEKGNITGVFAAARDVTEQKKAEKEILKLNRVYRTLSACNEALVHAQEESGLLSDICRIIVEKGGYRMAWVGYKQEDEQKNVKPMAQAGYEEGYLESTRITWADDELGRGPTGTAIRTGEISVNKDMLTNPVMLPWRDESIKRGYASSVGLPLRDNGEAFASLTLYAPESDAFNDEEVRLLRELAADLAYGIVTLRTRIERQQAEEALEQSERYLRSIIETSPMPMGSVNKDGQVTLLNDAFVRTFGYTVEDIHHVDMWFTQAYPNKEYREKTVGEWLHSIDEFVRSGTPILPLEVTITAKDGSSHIVDLYTTRIESETFVIFHDVTEKKHFEEAIRNQNEELEIKVKERTAQLEVMNKELEAFTYSVSHDLRAPLRSIDGFSSVVSEDYADRLDKDGKDYLQRIRNAAHKMSNLIDDLLSLSRLTRGELNKIEINISHTASEVIKTLREAEPGRDVDVSIAENMLNEADPHFMEIALTNLLNNAWKFTLKKDKAKIEFGLTEKDGRKVYFIKDNGAGFDMNYASKMFQPFQRLHTAEEFPGTGIGLATVYRIIKKHGGDIWAEGKVGEGATFYFTLG